MLLFYILFPIPNHQNYIKYFFFEIDNLISYERTHSEIHVSKFHNHNQNCIGTFFSFFFLNLKYYWYWYCNGKITCWFIWNENRLWLIYLSGIIIFSSNDVLSYLSRWELICLLFRAAWQEWIFVTLSIQFTQPRSRFWRPFEASV